ncbi:AraC family transcriptional regulator [Pleionea sp. CnH1-48]|uniref:helix-turn-helix domain-containing protein n=1 Tax=Pleionea sp. CnH1-48 TaxID=2954494 RepID=UPI00209740E0|nr:helix-turn-helix domain-containing protein [Pleionea sp. CnH1-48]MCO7224589.1 helix-turn-helix domain-containing protein [Pleionea sp. CnH1-48]
MVTLNFVNLIQAGTITVGILGALLLWRTLEFRGVALLLAVTAAAAGINILEESGITRDLYLISPVFIMLFGPAFFLATLFIVEKKLDSKQWLHLAPVLPMLLITSYPHVVIALGTVWRLIYAFLTVSLLVRYKRSLDEERSDSDEYSLNWLMWTIAVTAVFNLLDLLRLNLQPLLPYELNILGQGINNIIWLVAAMLIITKLIALGKLPEPKQSTQDAAAPNQPTTDNYQSLFTELDHLITTNKWYCRPRLTLSELSELTGLQTRDISRAINLVTQQSFNQYINQYRIDFVCDLLKRSPEQPLTDVYTEAGFSSKASFNKVFKQSLGVTPTEYKSQK